MDNNSKLHSEIGLAINRAKKQLYKRHREGMKIGDSVDLFMNELNESLNEVAPCEPVDEFVTVTLPNGKQVELSGDAVEMAKPAKPEAELAAHVKAIIEHPLTPASLYEAVAAFVCDGTNIKNAEGETLLERWSDSPETIAAVIAWTNERDDRLKGGAV